MSKDLMTWIAWVVVADIVVTLFFIRRFLAKQKASAAGAGAPGASGNAPAAIGGATAAIPSIVALRKFSDAIHPRIGEIVRSSWNGDADALPSVLAMALAETEREARNQGLALDRDLLKKVVELSVSKHHVTKSDVLREALQKVA
jgi:hypothetical protein